jgi:hypothetical protein
MNTPTTGIERPFTPGGSYTNESSGSAVSWAAIVAGAVTAIAVTLVLASLGAGVGLSSISPWPNSGASAKTFAVTTGIGLIVVQWLAALMGGYITGRLRAKWVGIHTHEVFFRDTAHGFLTWSLATLIGAIFLASATSSVVSGGIHAASTVAGGAAQGAGTAAGHESSTISSYDIEGLFRSDHPDAGSNSTSADAQAAHILETGITDGDVSAPDRAYLTQLVAAHAGISQLDAQKRVDDVISREKATDEKARKAADAARKASAEFAIFTALSMLIGAFIASAAAAYGGSLRDENIAFVE